MITEWRYLKQILVQKQIYPQYVEDNDSYFIKAYDGNIYIAECIINKNLNLEDVEDFESNFKTDSNFKLSGPTDSDGSPIGRVKVTMSGWHFHMHSFEFETSKLDSIYNVHADNSNHDFCAMKFYKMDNGNEVEITGDDLNQTFIDSNCVKTIIDWEPNHDYEIIGGMLKQKGLPSEDLRVWVIGVPDIPEAYGGSKTFVSGVNMSFDGLGDGVSADGKTAKYLTYDADMHTNKLRLLFRHPAGFKHKLMMIFQIFKQ